MDIIETLKKNLTETAQFAAEKAKLTKEILVTREQIRVKKKEIRNLTYKIGETYLDLHEEDAEEAFADFIRGIKEAKDEMETKEQELDDLKEQFKAAADVVNGDIDAEMAEFFEDEEDDEEVKETPAEEEAVAEETPAEEEAVAEEAPAEEEAVAEEVPVEETPAEEEAVAEEAAAEEEAPAEEAAAEEEASAEEAPAE